MKITFKLFASLSDYLPAERRGNVVEIEVADNATVQQIIDRYQLPAKMVHLVVINGVYVEPADRLTRTLNAGDALAIWPPIAGG